MTSMAGSLVSMLFLISSLLLPTTPVGPAVPGANMTEAIPENPGDNGPGLTTLAIPENPGDNGPGLTTLAIPENP